MKRICQFLTAILAVELGLITVFAWQHLNRPVPPELDPRRLDPVTAADLDRLRQRATDGGAREWREFAEACLGNGYYREAEFCFRQAAQLNPDDLQSHYGRGFCLERIGLTTPAIQVLRQTAQRADSELARTCWYQIGRGYLREENAAEAEQALRKIPDFPPAAWQLAKLLIRTGRAEQAIPLLDEQLAQLPNSLKLLQLRMKAAAAVGDHTLATQLREQEDRAQYQLVLEYGQQFIGMFAGRHGLQSMLTTAMRMKTEGTLLDRKAALQRALDVILPNDLWQYRSVLIAAAHVELGLGNPEAASQLAAEIRRHSHDGIDLLDLEASIASRTGKTEQAFEIWSRISHMKPSTELHAQLAEMADSELARYHQTQFILLSGIDAFRVNQLGTASQFLEQAATLLPEDPRTFYYLGRVRQATGDIDGAREALEKCVELDPYHGRAKAALQAIPTGS